MDTFHVSDRQINFDTGISVTPFCQFWIVLRETLSIPAKSSLLIRLFIRIVDYTMSIIFKFVIVKSFLEKS